MSNTLETKIRIDAIVDAAIKNLRSLKTEMAGVSTAGKTAGAAGLDGLTAGANDAASATRRTRDEVAALGKAESDAALARKKLAAEDKVNAKKTDDEAKQRRKDAKAANDQALKDARFQANQARQLGPQITDIVTGLATGQSPFQVLIQQGGQLKDIFGGVGNAARALVSVFTPLRLLIGATAAIAGTLAFEIFKGSQESLALAKSLAITGNIAGTTAGQLNEMAKSIATSQKAAIGDVRQTLAILVDTGAFTGSTLNTAGRAVTAYSKLTGKSNEDAIASFAEMSNGVADWAAKQNKAYNFITAAQFRYIQKLEAQGRTQEAMRFTLDTLSTTMEQRAAPALGTLEKAWAAVGRAVSGVADKLKAIGRDETPEERLKKVTERLAELQALQQRSLPPGQKPPKSRFLEQAQADVDNLRDQVNRKALREAESSIALQAEQEKIKQASKAFQDQLAQIDLAGSQKLLQQRLAALDTEQAQADSAFDRGLTSAIAHNVALNRVDQERLAAQAATIKRQIEIESARVEEKPEDKIAKKARVTELEGQLIEVQSRIRQAVSQGRGLMDADALQTAREKATEWAQLWQRAADQVRQFALENTASDAAKVASIVDRATEESKAKVAELQRQVGELRRDLELKISLQSTTEAEREELKRQLTDLVNTSSKNISTKARESFLASLQTQFSEVSQALQLKEQEIDQAVEQGAITTVQAERQKFEARAKALPQMREILELMTKMAVAPGEKIAAAQTANEVNKTAAAMAQLEATARGAAKSSLAQFFDDIATGAKSGKAALLDMVGSFAKAMLRLLEERLAEKLVAQFANAAGSAGGGGGGGGFLQAAATFFASFFHTGGVVGHSSGSAGRLLPAALFAAAPRYHSGGIIGLSSDEQPAILQNGEEVLTENDPRHRRNFSRSFGGVQLNASFTFNNAAGSEADHRDTGAQLMGVMQSAIETWAARESRVGGRLAPRGAN